MSTPVRMLATSTLIISLSLPAVTLAARPSCQGIHSEYAGPEITALEFQRSLVLNQFLTQSLNQSARPLKAQVPLVTPIAVIGAGLHGSIFSASAGALGRPEAVVTFEAGQNVSKVFGELGGSFLINSRETPRFSSNVFPHSPLTMKDLTSAKFANSLHMGALATVTQKASNSPVLFGHQIISVVDTAITKEEAPARYKLISSNGRVAYSQKVVLATGLGQASSRVPDPEFQSLLKGFETLSEKNPQAVYPVMTVDSFLRALTERIKAGKDFTSEIQNKTVAVIGVGDGAKIAIEALLEKSGSNIKILWLGQKAKTAEEYKDSTWNRYFGIAEHMGGRVTGGFEGHVLKGAKTTDGKILLTYGSDKKTVEADMVINATGYDNVIPEILKSLSGSSSEQKIDYLPVTGTVKGSATETVIGKRVQIEGLPAQEIYVMGPAGGAMATPKELEATRTQNPVSVEVLAPRSEALAAKLINDVTSRSREVLEKASLAKVITKEIRTASAPDLNLDLDLRGLRNLAQVEITAFLNHFEWKAEILHLQILKGPSADSLLISLSGISPASAEKVINRLGREPELMAVLQTWMNRQGSGQLIYEGP